jgi:hypothetical protein
MVPTHELNREGLRNVFSQRVKKVLALATRNRLTLRCCQLAGLRGRLGAPCDNRYSQSHSQLHSYWPLLANHGIRQARRVRKVRPPRRRT